MAGPAFGPDSMASKVVTSADTIGATSRQVGTGGGSGSAWGVRDAGGAAKSVVSGRFIGTCSHGGRAESERGPVRALAKRGHSRRVPDPRASYHPEALQVALAAGVPGHGEPGSLSIDRDHTATTVANPMEQTMSWTNRITLAAALIGGAVALMAYAQALSLPAHFV